MVAYSALNRLGPGSNPGRSTNFLEIMNELIDPFGYCHHCRNLIESGINFFVSRDIERQMTRLLSAGVWVQVPGGSPIFNLVECNSAK